MVKNLLALAVVAAAMVMASATGAEAYWHHLHYWHHWHHWGYWHPWHHWGYWHHWHHWY